MNELEQKRKRIELAVKITAFSIIGFLVAPVILLVIKGLVGLIVAGIIGFAAIQFAPYLGMVIANWRLKALKAEARKNPVETLQNIYVRKEDDV